MSHTGKRSRHHRDYENERESHRKRPLFGKETTPNRDDLVIYRILCPDKVIGSVIGKNGKVINSIRQEANARVKVVDPFPGADKRIILIYCSVRNRDGGADEDDCREPVCPAQDALLKVHDAIVDALWGNNDSERNDKKEVTILVPASQAASVIGKSGVVIKKLRSRTRALIKVSPKDPSDATHSCAMSFDNFIHIAGDPEAVRKALFAVSTIIYKFPAKETISLDTSLPELQPSIVVPSDLPIYSSGSFLQGPDVIRPVHSGLSVMRTRPHLAEFSGLSDAVSALPIYPTALPAMPGYNGSTNSRELVLRLLCPPDKIGRVIGKGGMTIKSIRKDSGARIEAEDSKNGKEEALITITSNEATDDMKSAAVEAILLLQSKINDEEEERVNIRMLVATKVIGCLIGKGGSIVNDMRKLTRAEIRISKGEKPKRASSADELVEISGEVNNVRDALVQTVLRLRDDVLGDKEDSKSYQKDGNSKVHLVDPLYAGAIPLSTLLPSISSVPSLSYDRRAEAERGLGVYPGSSLYGYSSLQAGDDGYSTSSYTSKTYGTRLSYLDMPIPPGALSKVMGRGGTNLDNIRKISGARIEIVDSKSSRYDHIAQIYGTSEQRTSAENLIRAFIIST